MVVITNISFRPVELPLVAPLLTARGAIRSRQVLLVGLKSGNFLATGEAAPLPEHGTESYDTAFDVIARLAGRRTFPRLRPDIRSLGRWLNEAGVSREFAPAAAWALECALLSLVARSRHTTLLSLLHTSAPKRIAVSRLISSGTTGEILWAVERALTLGYDTVKIKLGRRTVVQDIDTIRKLRARFGDRLKIRVDANEEWSLEHAWEFCEGVRKCGLQYIEDPLREPTAEKLLLLKTVSRVPIALDQMANTPQGFERILADRLCRVVVLKPGVIGSFALIRRMVRQATARRIFVVFSNLIESSIGISYAAACAAAWGSRRYAHGLATATLLARDTVEQPLSPVHGAISLTDFDKLSS